MKHEEWIKGIEEGLTPTVAAKTAGLSHTTVLRQMNRGGLSSESVIAIARAYKVSIVDALVDTGHINEDEVKIIGVIKALGYATNEQILNEMLSRVDPQATRMFHGEDGEITPSFSGNVHQLPDRTIPPEWHELAVADSSPDHDEEDTDFD